MIVKKQKPIYFKNECNCIVDYSELEKAILWFQERPTYSNKKIYLHGKYPCVTIHNKKIHIHRLLMCYWNNNNLDTSLCVHHILNREHGRTHNKGKIISEAQRENIRKANKKRKGTKIKKQHNIPLYELKDLLSYGFSINFISKLYKVSWDTIRTRIYQNPELLGE